MEAALPTALAPCTLETLGEWDFGGRLGTAMTAHPKMDPETGEMLFFGYSPFPPYLVYHVADRTGALVRSEPIDLAWPSMIHDFAVTKDHVVFILCPLVFSFENAKERGGVFSWDPERGALGVMPRDGQLGRRAVVRDPVVRLPSAERVRRWRSRLDVARYDKLDHVAEGRRAIRSGRPRRLGCIAGRSTAGRRGEIDAARRRVVRVRGPTSGGSAAGIATGTRPSSEADGEPADLERDPPYDLDRGTFGDAVRRAAAPASRSSCRAAGQRGGRRLGDRPRLRCHPNERLPRARAADIAGELVATVKLPHRVPRTDSTAAGCRA
jgi:carotenoid cleavage dioxygenase